MKNLIESIEINKHMMNERIYRSMIAKAFVLFYSNRYTNKSEIQFKTNVELLKRNLKHVSYSFVCDTLKD